MLFRSFLLHPDALGLALGGNLGLRFAPSRPFSLGLGLFGGQFSGVLFAELLLLRFLLTPLPVESSLVLLLGFGLRLALGLQFSLALGVLRLEPLILQSNTLPLFSLSFGFGCLLLLQSGLLGESLFVNQPR